MLVPRLTCIFATELVKSVYLIIAGKLGNIIQIPRKILILGKEVVWLLLLQVDGNVLSLAH